MGKNLIFIQEKGVTFKVKLAEIQLTQKLVQRDKTLMMS